MSQFNVDKNQNGEELTLALSGQIDEDASFNGADLSGASQIVLDLKGVASINSCGIREWIKWIKTASDGTKITFKNCPKIIVDQINMVSGFLPENGQVESFYVPYYSEESGNEKMVLFLRGKEFLDSGEINPPDQVKCDDSGEEMEMDVIEAKYFKFLNKT